MKTGLILKYNWLLLLSLLTACDSFQDDAFLEKNDKIENSQFSKNEVGVIAKRFSATWNYNKNKEIIPEKPISKISVMPPVSLTRSGAATAPYYVVSYEDGGYAVVSSDARLENPVLIYSEDGEFAGPDDVLTRIYLENVDACLKNKGDLFSIKDTSSTIRRAPSPADPLRPIKWDGEENGREYTVIMQTDESQIDKLIQTSWHQGIPYNRECELIFPPDEIGGNAVTGCVAVAMGQICAYHKCPEEIGGKTLDWNLMLSQLSYSTSIEDYQKVCPVAFLLCELGKLVKMEYGLHYSNSNINYAFEAFKQIGFSNVKRESYSFGSVKNELRAKRPVYVRGETPSRSAAHAFVIDGYKATSSVLEYYWKDTGELFRAESGRSIVYLHFNVGSENASSNAYYLVNDNGSTNYDYSSFMQLITNIKP